MIERMDGQVGEFAQDTWSGKTFQEHSQADAKKAQTLQPSSKKLSKSASQEPLCQCVCRMMDGQNPDVTTLMMEPGALLGEFTTLSFGESPREENASHLLRILEDYPHQKYFLSARACQGILKRAQRRGNKLPKELETGLKEQIAAMCTAYEETDLDQTECSAILNAEQPMAVYDARGNGNGHISPTLTGDHQNRVTDYTALCIGNGQANNISMSEHCNTLDTMHDQQAVYVPALAHSLKEKRSCDFREDSETYAKTVRRLTPLECERLQGFPDGWTDIGDWVDSNGRKRHASDTVRYKALGNSIALPFWFWLLRRISAQYERPATLGSLFDGIGGFPLCWERCNGNGTALWASEIEEFPIAVTRKRFGED